MQDDIHAHEQLDLNDLLHLIASRLELVYDARCVDEGLECLDAIDPRGARFEAVIVCTTILQDGEQPEPVVACRIDDLCEAWRQFAARWERGWDGPEEPVLTEATAQVQQVA